MVSLYFLIIYAKDDQGATASQTILIQIAVVNETPIFIGSLAQRDQGTELLSWGRKDPVDICMSTSCPVSSHSVMVIRVMRRIMITKVMIHDCHLPGTM